MEIIAVMLGAKEELQGYIIYECSRARKLTMILYCPWAIVKKKNTQALLYSAC
jgi:hypothetical protein